MRSSSSCTKRRALPATTKRVRPTICHRTRSCRMSSRTPTTPTTRSFETHSFSTHSFATRVRRTPSFCNPFVRNPFVHNSTYTVAPSDSTATLRQGSRIRRRRHAAARREPPRDQDDLRAFRLKPFCGSAERRPSRDCIQPGTDLVFNPVTEARRARRWRHRPASMRRFAANDPPPPPWCFDYYAPGPGP